MRRTGLVALLFAACAAGAAGQMPMTPVDEGSHSSIEDKREIVVRSLDEWTALWNAHAPGRPRAAVDFTNSMVVGVFLGTRPTGGHAVAITRIAREGDALIVTYHERKPASSDIVTQMLTAPYVLVATERFNGPIRFVKSTP